ncbi:unnamed protein product [Cyclocybe aegerita]|uniref:NACHT domain-containing protein n=1 Tax=Cyclocybe aegerita TaxID=1973307 RepID=A0A8S0WHQ2_CYCAE|nr:unnamed protein product [Cyclocybe aegerita]
MLRHARNVVINGGEFYNVDVWQNQSVSALEGIELLYAHTDPGALHNSEERYDPPKCHPLTRQAILDKLVAWIEDMDDKGFEAFWVYGSAGVGKSAIMQTLAELFHAKCRLLASFFFSRTSPTRNTPVHFITTLSYQVALCSPRLREAIRKIVSTDRSIFARSLETQLQALVVKPILEARKEEDSDIPTLIIIDGLDECHSPDDQNRILRALTNALKDQPLGIKLIIASRPEQAIRTEFDSGALKLCSRRLSLNDSSLRAWKDIDVFLRHKFLEIKTSHPLRSYIPDGWPSKYDLDLLVRKSSSDFIFPSVVMRFVESPRHRPVERLKRVCGSSPREGGDTPFGELDALYTTILSSVENITPVLEALLVLYTIRLLEPEGRKSNISSHHCLSVVARTLRYTTEELRVYLMDLTSLIDLEATDDTCIRIFHASFTDFLMDEKRSQKYYIDAEWLHSNIASRCVFHCSYIYKMKGLHDLFNTRLTQHYVTCFLLWHLGKISPSEALVRQLSDLDTTSVLVFNNSEFVTSERWRLFFGIVNFIRTLKRPYAEGMYLEKMRSLEDYLKHKFSIYHSEPALRDFVTSMMWYFMMDYDGIEDSKERRAPMWNIVMIDLNATYEDSCILHLCGLIDQDNQSEIVPYLREFLLNPERAGEFRIDGQRYASLSLQFAKRLYSELLALLEADTPLGNDANTKQGLSDMSIPSTFLGACRLLVWAAPLAKPPTHSPLLLGVV